MMPKWHIFYGVIFSSLLYFVTGYTLIASLIVFLSSIFIDLDKVILFILKEKSLNFFEFWRQEILKRKLWEKRKNNTKFKHEIRFLHGIEVFIILLIFSIIHEFFFFIFLGFFFHILLDVFDYVYHGEDFFNKLSIIYTMITNKNKKKLD